MPANRHAEVSPSSFPQLELCSCFETGEVGEAAEKGTYEHDVLEKMMRGQPIEGVEEDVLEKVTWAYEFATEMAKRYEVPVDKIEIEKEVHVVDENMNEITFGTIDIGFQGFIFDYKSGEIRNYKPQMACYALGQMQAKGLRVVHVFELYGRYKKAVDYEINIDEAQSIVNTIYWAAKGKDKKPTKNNYCNWCRFRTSCPEITGDVKKVGAALPDTPLTAKKLGQLIKKPVTELKPAELEKLMPFVETVESWAGAVKDHLIKVIQSGKEIAGYKMKEKIGNQFIKDHAEAIKLSGLDDAELKEFMTVSVTALTKALAKKDKITQKAAKEEIQMRLMPVLDRKASSYSLSRA
jgi:CRISPR/Cas system-associated exonuclease Cas4 (RecB family)